MYCCRLSGSPTADNNHVTKMRDTHGMEKMAMKVTGGQNPEIKTSGKCITKITNAIYLGWFKTTPGLTLNDVCDVRIIHTPRRNVTGEQDPPPALPELLRNLLPEALGLARVNLHHRHAHPMVEKISEKAHESRR
mmetsp:Transcript_41627/g.126220  ORF Transcript_41627/g.126220 Transcript_41627/m.126220 type:complete len:135 (+) Transcript_41627:509-913(+)